MLRDFDAASLIPVDNAGLVRSVFAGGDDYFLTCSAVCVSKFITPSIWTVDINPSDPVLSKQSQVFTKALRTGGFLWIKQGDQTPKLLVLRSEDGRCWQPSNRYASETPFKALFSSLVARTGLALIDHDKRLVDFVMPSFRLKGNELARYEEVLKTMRIKEISQAKFSRMKDSITHRVDLDGYTLGSQSVVVELVEEVDRIMDRVEINCAFGNKTPLKGVPAFISGMRRGDVAVNLPFIMRLPANLEIVALDPTGMERQVALFSQNELGALRRSCELSADLSDYVCRLEKASLDAVPPPKGSILSGPLRDFFEPRAA